MNLMMIMMVVIFILLSMMTIMILTFSKKTIKDMQKSSPFECGFNPMSYPRVPFSIHFFLIAVIFLIFDIEIILIMPMILTVKSSTLLTWIMTSTCFVLILIMGLFHEWKNGMIDWTN